MIIYEKLDILHCPHCKRSQENCVIYFVQTVYDPTGIHRFPAKKHYNRQCMICLKVYYIKALMNGQVAIDINDYVIKDFNLY